MQGMAEDQGICMRDTWRYLRMWKPGFEPDNPILPHHPPSSGSAVVS